MRDRVSQGRKPSAQWRSTAASLAEHGLTPAQYIGEMRGGGASWAEIGATLADDCNLSHAPQPGTLQFWLMVEPTPEWVPQ